MKKEKIIGQKVALVPIQESDAAEMMELRNDPALNRYLSNSNQEISLDHQLNWMRSAIKNPDAHDFTIRLQENNAFCGTIALYDIKDGAAEFGRYIATNALAAIESEYLVLKYGFERLNLERIYCNTPKENKKVWQQHTKFGFRTTGEDFDDRIRMARVCQEISKEDFGAFDYGPILRLVERI